MGYMSYMSYMSWAQVRRFAQAAKIQDMGIPNSRESTISQALS